MHQQESAKYGCRNANNTAAHEMECGIKQGSQVSTAKTSTLEETSEMRKQKGFSLIELLIVVAIILIIAAIAIPNLMRSRIAANDSAAAATVRTLNTSEVTYANLWGSGINYGTLANLGPGATSACTTPTVSNACIVDSLLGCSTGTSGAFCTRDAFKYTITVIRGVDYITYAIPTAATQGDKDYCSAPDLVVRVRSDPTAGGATLATDTTCEALSAL